MSGIEDLPPELAEKYVKFGRMVLEAKDPKIVSRGKRLAREVDPSLRLPEIDLEDQIAAMDKKHQELVDQIEQKNLNERVAARERAAADKIKASGFTAEEIEKIVKDEGLVGEHAADVAIKLATLTHEAASPGAADVNSPGPWAGGPKEIRPDKELRRMAPDQLRKWSNDTAREMMTDALRRLRGGR